MCRLAFLCLPGATLAQWNAIWGLPRRRDGARGAQVPPAIPRVVEALNRPPDNCHACVLYNRERKRPGQGKLDGVLELHGTW